MRFRGDEADLYLEFNDKLVRTIYRSVHGHMEDVEDGCAHAWVQFLRYQPSREGNWRGWLFRTAQREAWRLTAQRPEVPFTSSRHASRRWS